MCENCRNSMREVIAALLEDDTSHELVQAAHREVDQAMEALVPRIQAYAEEHPEIDEIPTEDEIRSNLWDSSMAAMIAVAAAQIASKTEGYIDEAGLPPSIVLGQWAGITLKRETELAGEEMLIHLLGLGLN